MAAARSSKRSMFYKPARARGASSMLAEMAGPGQRSFLRWFEKATGFTAIAYWLP